MRPPKTLTLTNFSEFYNCANGVAAAALRALADQVVPETTTPWNSTLTPVISAKDVRAEIFAIAAELEGAYD